MAASPTALALKDIKMDSGHFSPDDTFQDNLKILHRMTLELSQAESVDDIYRRGVEIGIRQLGFERVGIFKLDRAGDAWWGTYGTDLDGNLRAEHNHTGGFSVLVKLFWQDLISNRDQVILRDEAVLYDKDSEVGIGWHATAGLWKGNDIFALLFIDNAITHREQRPFEQELISLYSSTLAQVIQQQEIKEKLHDSQQQYHELFENVPIAVLVEDFSAVKTYIDGLKEEGVSDFQAYFASNPDAVQHCADSIKIIDANHAAVDLYGVSSKHQLTSLLSTLLNNSNSFGDFRNEIIDLAEGKMIIQHNAHLQISENTTIEVHLVLRIAPSAEDTWSRVFVAINEISDYPR